MKKDQGHRTLQRNDPCHCGSGKKYKNCCWQKDQDARTEADLDRRTAELQAKLNPIDNPDWAPGRTRTGSSRQMNRGEMFWAALQQNKGPGLPEIPVDVSTDPFDHTTAFSKPPKAKASKKKK